MSCESFLEKLDLFLDHEAGRHELPPGVVGELRHHLASCRLCRWEVSRAISLSTAVRSLPDRTPPVAEPPHSRRRARPVRAGGPRGRRFRSRLPSVAAAITLVAASVGLLGLFGRFGTGEREDFDRPGSAALARSGWEARGLEVVEGRDRGGGSSREAAIGTRLRAVDPDASLVASCGTGLHCRRGATLRVSPSDAVRLVEGEMLARIASDPAKSVEVGEFEIRGPGAVIFASVGSIRDAELEAGASEGQAAEASEPAGGTFEGGVDAGDSRRPVTIAVIAGSATVSGAFGSTTARASEALRLEPGAAPIRMGAARMAPSLADGSDRGSVSEVDELRSIVARLEDRVAAQEVELERLRRLEDERERAGGGLAAAAPWAEDEEGPGKPDAIREELRGLAADAGVAGVFHPAFSVLVERVRALGPAGTRFVADEMRQVDPVARYLAVAMAGRLGADALVEELASLVEHDTDGFVRRAASGSLAVLEDPSALDVLARVYGRSDEDVVVKVNAWYGLARLGHEAAFEDLSPMFDSVGGEINEDLVLATVLLVRDPRLHPRLREVFDREAISLGYRKALLDRLGRDPAYGSGFLWEVASDPSRDPEVREHALRLLD